MQLKILVRGYSQEIKWRDEHYVPETIDEHLEVSKATVGAFQVACSSFVGMGDIITKEILDWLLSYPKLLKSMTTFVRLSNDIASTKVFFLSSYMSFMFLYVYLHTQKSLYIYIVSVKFDLTKQHML